MRKKDKQQYINLSDIEVARLYQDGDNLALEYLIHKYNNYIHKVASGYYNRTTLESDDILAEAMIGFMEGVKRYDAEGYFMYFTGLWMKVKIFVAIDSNSRLIRIPVNRLKDMRKINAFLVKYPIDQFSIEEMAIATGIDEDKISEYIYSDTSFVDIETQYSLEDTNDHTNIYKNFDSEDLKHDLDELLSSLSEIELYIITRLYGLQGQVKTDKVTIGENLNISSERVRQIKDRVIRRFRHASYSSLLIQYLE